MTEAAYELLKLLNRNFNKEDELDFFSFSTTVKLNIETIYADGSLGVFRDLRSFVDSGHISLADLVSIIEDLQRIAEEEGKWVYDDQAINLANTAPEMLRMLKIVDSRLDIVKEEAQERLPKGLKASVYTCGAIHNNIKAIIKQATKWICTDPDNNQYRLDEGQNVWKDTRFTFKEDGIMETVDLKDYTLEKINSIISAYGYIGNGDCYYINGTDKEIDNSIIAECIFEIEFTDKY